MNHIKQIPSGFLGNKPRQEADFNTLEELFNIDFVKFYIVEGNWILSKHNNYLIVTHNKMKNSWFIGEIKFPDLLNLPQWRI
jgi:hypothetical protein